MSTRALTLMSHNQIWLTASYTCVQYVPLYKCICMCLSLFVGIMSSVLCVYDYRVSMHAFKKEVCMQTPYRDHCTVMASAKLSRFERTLYGAFVLMKCCVASEMDPEARYRSRVLQRDFILTDYTEHGLCILNT